LFEQPGQVFGEHADVTPHVLKEHFGLLPGLLDPDVEPGQAHAEVFPGRESWQNLLDPRGPKIDVFRICAEASKGKREAKAE